MKSTCVCSSMYVHISVIHTYVYVTKSICEKMYIRSNACSFMYLHSTPSPLSHYTYNIMCIMIYVRTYVYH